MATSASLAASYARWRSSPLGAITERVEERVVFELAGPLQGRRLLDVGTGDGTYAIEAARRGAEVTGLDVDQAMLAAARARSASGGVTLTLREGRAEALPFEDDGFDVVLAVTVLCFAADATTAVREMARVLRPGGRLVLGELGRFSLWAAERRVRGWLGSGTWRRARFWSRADLATLAREAGLHAVEVRGSVFFPPSPVAARLVAPFEPTLTRIHAPGAAFLALAAYKPEVRP
ncbi:MAG: class I SAM-dependent methyltransferase [Deltaproteobacteria bacterium]|nr:class I SAM-dependent methyltransferase [Deltaproteobacteria bacterium]